MLKEFVISELAGEKFTAYDSNNNEVLVGIAKKNAKTINSNRKKSKVLKELYSSSSLLRKIRRNRRTQSNQPDGMGKKNE